MKIKDFLLPVFIGILTFSLFRYFSPEEITVNNNDKSFVAPLSAQEVVEALNFDVDFYNTKAVTSETITEINTGKFSLDFSNFGGLIKKISYTHDSGGTIHLIETITPDNAKESGAFLVAFNGSGTTPYYYELIENKKQNGITTLVYKSSTDKLDIVKEFKVYDDSYKIDLALSVTPKNNSKLKARIFFEGPFIADANLNDIQKAVLFLNKGGIEKKLIKDIKLFGKAHPSLFGLEDKYFVNALVNDSHGFASRAYFKTEGNDKANTFNTTRNETENSAETNLVETTTETPRATVILESEYIREPKSWVMSFYFGPKETSAFSNVDTRLDGIFDYGILTFVSKPILYILDSLYYLFNSYGLAIIILTLLIKLLFLPFMVKTQNNKNKPAETQRKFKYVEQKYKDDPQMLALKKAELAKEQLVPGLVMLLPVLLQMPILIGLSRVLSNAIELYKVSFLWIPDLSLKDPYFIFPILLGVCIAIRNTQFGTAQQKISNILLALFVAGFTSNLSAGLTIYIAISALLDIGQTYLQKFIK